MHLQVILIGSSNWGAFEGDLGDVHWIPSKCGTFGGHLGGDLFFTLLGFLPAGGLLDGALVFLIGFLPSGACLEG